MIKARKFLAVALLLPMLGACASYDLSTVDMMEQQGDAFDQSLHKEYMMLAHAEAAEQDWEDAWFFANKAKSSANGNSEEPQLVSERDIVADAVDLLESVRSALMDQLPAGRTEKPEIAARAQAMFDCWLQEKEENFQPDHIKACRDSFNIAYFQLIKVGEEKAMAPAEPMAKMAGPYMVFFGFDKDGLDRAGLALIESVAKHEMAMDPNALITVSGHADRSGAKDYNMMLSEQRAISVSIALQLAGAQAKIAMEHFGEESPLKPTDDGVREPKNRRVEIKIGR
ncbi:MAG: OmpA family protein [Rhodospirillales bacterium]